jgi:glyoxylase I family protein
MSPEPTANLALSLHHLAVRVRDLARAEAFYVGTLGLRVLRRFNDDAKQQRSLWVALGGGAFLAIERADGDGHRCDNDPGWHCVALGITADRRAHWRQHLLGCGVSVFRESDYTLYIRDPDGNIVALSHYPVASTDDRRAPS